MRASDDAIEKEGIARALARAEDADIILQMSDFTNSGHYNFGTTRPGGRVSVVSETRHNVGLPSARQRASCRGQETEAEAISETKWNEKIPFHAQNSSDSVKNITINILNKIDENKDKILDKLDDFDVMLSAQTGEGMENLLEILQEKLHKNFPVADSPYIIRARYRNHLQNCLKFITNCEQILHSADVTIICEELRSAAQEIGKITGKFDVEELLGEIFSSFCIGK